jgi:hypothetical protein
MEKLFSYISNRLIKTILVKSSFSRRLSEVGRQANELFESLLAQSFSKEII